MKQVVINFNSNCLSDIIIDKKNLQYYNKHN